MYLLRASPEEKKGIIQAIFFTHFGLRGYKIGQDHETTRLERWLAVSFSLFASSAPTRTTQWWYSLNSYEDEFARGKNTPTRECHPPRSVAAAVRPLAATGEGRKKIPLPLQAKFTESTGRPSIFISLVCAKDILRKHHVLSPPGYRVGMN